MKATGHGLTEQGEAIRSERKSLKAKVARLATRRWNMQRANLDTTEISREVVAAINALTAHEVQYGIGFERVR